MKAHTLAAWLHHDFARSDTWDGLRKTLRTRGYDLVLHGGNLSLGTADGRVICATKDLGYPYVRLSRQFGAPFATPREIRSPR